MFVAAGIQFSRTCDVGTFIPALQMRKLRHRRACVLCPGKSELGAKVCAFCPRPGAVAQSPGREAALAWASLAQRFPASSVLAREGACFGSVGDVPGAWLASAPLSPSLWT